MAGLTWNSTTVKTERALRDAMKKAVGAKKGKTLIDTKFATDHVFAGHGGSVTKLAAVLAGLRSPLPKGLSTLMTGSMDTTSRDEVLNWIATVPFTAFTYAGGVWALATAGNAVPGAHSYDFATVDYPVYKALKLKQPGDVITKSRKWLTETTSKAVGVVCWFTSTSDCMPVIYHLNF